MKRIVLCLVLAFVMGNVLAVEGVSPGSYEVDFFPRDDSGDPEPGLEREFVFDFYMDGEETLIVEGDLAKYAQLDKEKVSWSERVVVTLRLPEEVEGFGVHNIWIVAGDVRGLVKVNVAYPERFVGLELGAPNVNVGEDVEVGLGVLNLGSVEVFVNASIFIYDWRTRAGGRESKVESRSSADMTLVSPRSGGRGGLVEVIQLGERWVVVSGREDFEIVLDTENYSAGDYLAVARVDYGDGVAEEENVFRLGEFGVRILNYTREVGGGVGRFEVEVESLWDDRIGEVFAEVRVVGGDGGFDTGIVELGAWEKKKLVGFFDARELEGEVVLSIDVHYDEGVESEVVRVYVMDGFGWVFWVGIFLVLVFGFLGWKFFMSGR